MPLPIINNEIPLIIGIKLDMPAFFSVGSGVAVDSTIGTEVGVGAYVIVGSPLAVPSTFASLPAFATMVNTLEEIVSLPNLSFTFTVTVCWPS